MDFSISSFVPLLCYRQSRYARSIAHGHFYYKILACIFKIIILYTNNVSSIQFSFVGAKLHLWILTEQSLYAFREDPRFHYTPRHVHVTYIKLQGYKFSMIASASIEAYLKIEQNGTKVIRKRETHTANVCETSVARSTIIKFISGVIRIHAIRTNLLDYNCTFARY